MRSGSTPLRGAFDDPGRRADGRLTGTVMVGHDGHRGWVYYLAVAEDEDRVSAER